MKKVATKILIDPSKLIRGSYYIIPSGQLTHYIGKGTVYVFSCFDLTINQRLDVIDNPFQFTLNDYKQLYTEINGGQKRSGYIFGDSLKYINNNCIINNNLSSRDYNVLTYPQELIKLYKQLSYNKSFFVWSFNNNIVVFDVQ